MLSKFIVIGLAQFILIQLFKSVKGFTNPFVYNMQELSWASIKICQSLMSKPENLDKDPFIVCSIILHEEQCPFPKLSCNPNDRYASIDGTCNNLNRPLFGRSNTPFKRYLSPAYEDQLNSARSKSATGRNLPNPRALSLAFSSSSQSNETNANFTHLLVIFGQFLAHDLTLTASTSG
jgi:hypothetical protein